MDQESGANQQQVNGFIDRKRLDRSNSSAVFSLAGSFEQRPANSQCGSSMANHTASASYGTIMADNQQDSNNNNWSKLLVSRANPAQTREVAGDNKQQHKSNQKYYGMMSNEQLLDGFMLLRLMQFINLDIHYIGLESKPAPPLVGPAAKVHDKQQPRKGTADDEPPAADLEASFDDDYANDAPTTCPPEPSSLMRELAQMNPLGHLLESNKYVASVYKYLKILASLVALLISVDKTLSTILLCLLAKIDSKSPGVGIKAPSMGLTNEASDISMSWVVLILVNLSSTYIIFSIIFRGHLLWQLLSQRLFLVSRSFQYKVMLSLLVFVYLEYIINISFINNLFGWSLVKGDLDHAIDYSQLAEKQHRDRENIHNAYSVLNNLKKFVTEQDDEHTLNDILLTILQFARGIIRISPYITINYVIICLVEHIKTIRNQNLLTDSLKRRQKLRLVVKNRRANLRQSATRLSGGASNRLASNRNPSLGNSENNRRKRVIFVTESSSAGLQSPANNELNPSPLSQLQLANYSPTPSCSSSLVHNYYSHRATPNSLGGRSVSSLSEGRPGLAPPNKRNHTNAGDSYSSAGNRPAAANDYLSRIKDFDELESYVTNLYIFTGRLNLLMSRQGLAVFFIVHNLVITCALIVPEAIRGGPPMVALVRLLVILIGIVPFICGQSLNGQLEQLSKQIDRIIIQQQFTSRRRDNLVRIRELLHDIRVNCGGMLDFNVETGIKYLVVSFASAFFIEQEDYKLTRRQ